ncbi:hypothetical protein HDU83_002080 [Entophlyctis luteolus]|nr:hypothetical protein HDU83_002080 [Entophlyctis luteolus]
MEPRSTSSSSCIGVANGSHVVPLGFEGGNAPKIPWKSFNNPTPATLATPNASILASIVANKMNAVRGASSGSTRASPTKRASASPSRVSMTVTETGPYYPQQALGASRSHGFLDMRVISASTLVDESVSEEERISDIKSPLAPVTVVATNESGTLGELKNKKKKKKNSKKKRGKQKKKTSTGGEQGDVPECATMEESLTNKTASNDSDDSSDEGLEEGTQTVVLNSLAEEKVSIQAHLAEVAEALTIRDFAGGVATEVADSNCLESKIGSLPRLTAIPEKLPRVGGIPAVSESNLSISPDFGPGNAYVKRNSKSSVMEISNEEPSLVNKNHRSGQTSSNASPIPEFQKLVVSSAVDPSFYADIIDEVTRVLGYQLISLSRKPDVHPSHGSQTLRRSFQYDTQTAGGTCVKGSLHMQVQRSAKSAPLTRAALLTLQKKTTSNRHTSQTSVLHISATADANAATPIAQDVQKCDLRVVRAAAYGAYVSSSSCASVPEVVCIVARGGFGVPVLRRFSAAPASQRVEDEGWELVGVRWVRGGLGEHQARAVTPYAVGDPKWRDSLQWLCTTTGESGDGYMVVVVRKIDAFREVDAILASLLESYISINSQSDSSSTSHSSSCSQNLTKTDCLGLSLLSSLNAEMAYSTLTVFFRDFDLIPPRQSPHRRRYRREHGPDDSHAAVSGAAIAQSLVSPPRGAYTFCMLQNTEGPGAMRGVAALCALLVDSGCVVCGLRVTALGHVTAGRMAELPECGGVDSEGATGDEGDFDDDDVDAGETVGVQASDFRQWVTEAGSVIMVVVWGVEVVGFA